VKIYALLDNTNIIVNVITCEDDITEEELQTLLSVNNAFSYKEVKENDYFGVGLELYKDRFRWPNPPYPSWVWSEESFEWQAPIQQPAFDTYWDEETKSWLKLVFIEETK